jgi:hypothetical protein
VLLLAVNHKGQIRPIGLSRRLPRSIGRVITGVGMIASLWQGVMINMRIRRCFGVVGGVRIFSSLRIKPCLNIVGRY